MTPTPPPYARTTARGRIRIRPLTGNWLLPTFLLSTALLTLLALVALDLPWLKLASRVPDFGRLFAKLACLDVSRASLLFDALLETLSIAFLSTLYGILLGLLLGLLAAENILRNRLLARTVQTLCTFLRVVPTPIWVLLMMVCLGMGPVAGIAGLCVHTTAFFARAFAQSFEDLPAETLEALETTGIGRLGVFLHAVLPATLSQLIAWSGMRLEINFSECAILGMVGAGGIGFVIANSIQNYEYGTAGTAILLVFLLATAIERAFVFLKRRLR
ncbi:MAG: PhnE/PtxC family ABC transporter permease [Candidatus Spyradenecus sp.]